MADGPEAPPRPEAGEVADLELKVAELTHRLKNLLAMVQAVAWQTLQPDRSIEEARDALDGRIAALGRAIDLFHRKTWEEADLSELLAVSLTTPRRRWTAEGPPCAVSSQVAMSMVLIFQELECNAIKHGAYSSDAGRVLVEWAVRDGAGGRLLDFTWSERGGPPALDPHGEGTGSRLLARIVGRLDGSWAKRFLSTGFEWRMTLPTAALGS